MKEPGDGGRDASVSRLHARLRRALSRERASVELSRRPRLEVDREPGSDAEPSAAADSALREVPSREPLREGSLLVWREVFHESDWRSSEAPVLFGEGADPGDLRSEIRKPLAAEEHGPEEGIARFAWVDIETCGLGDAPIFLVGILIADVDPFSGLRLELEQFFAPDPSSEPAVLERSIARLAERPDWVSFNGRSFDIPRMRGRARTHRLEFPECREHLDLLHAVRRRWKESLPNCKLSTVEERLLGLRRLPGDVPGREVPDRYFDFVHGGVRRWIDPVIEHNRRDVAALLVLHRRLLEVPAP